MRCGVFVALGLALSALASPAAAQDDEIDGLAVPESSEPEPLPTVNEAPTQFETMTSAPEPEPDVMESRPRPRRHRRPRVEHRWYGWQTLLVDAVSVGTFVVKMKTDQPTVPLWLFGYLFGPPIVHGAHGNTKTAFGSFGLRLGAPIVCAGLGAKGDSSRPIEGALVGALFGTALAITVDASVLAVDEVPLARPSVDVRRDHALISVSGGF